MNGRSTAETGTLDTLYGVGFNTGHAMVSGPAANTFTVNSSTPVQFSPLTEFLNGSTDRLYVGAFAEFVAEFH